MTTAVSRLRLADKLASPFRAAYLKALISAAEKDLAYMQHEVDRVPLVQEQMRVHRQYIEALRVRLITGGQS